MDYYLRVSGLDKLSNLLMIHCACCCPVYTQNGSRIPVPKPVFVNSGTSPPGSTWSRMPIPGSGYGHRCACDLTNDDHGDHPQVRSDCAS